MCVGAIFVEDFQKLLYSLFPFRGLPPRLMQVGDVVRADGDDDVARLLNGHKFDAVHPIIARRAADGDVGQIFCAL